MNINQKNRGPYVEFYYWVERCSKQSRIQLGIEANAHLRGAPCLETIRERQAIDRLAGRKGLRGKRAIKKVGAQGRVKLSATGNKKHFRMLKKLWKHPDDFFNDSKHTLLRSIGKLAFPPVANR